MRAHPPWQSAHPPQDQPAIERRGDCAAFVLNTADPLEEVAVFFRNDNSTKNVATAAQVLSHTQSAPVSCTSSPTAARSTIFNSGLDGVSIQASFVCGRSAFFTALRLLMSMKSACNPQRRKISRSNRDVP